jgi:hypothetical protein
MITTVSLILAMSMPVPMAFEDPVCTATYNFGIWSCDNDLYYCDFGCTALPEPERSECHADCWAERQDCVMKEDYKRCQCDPTTCTD